MGVVFKVVMVVLLAVVTHRAFRIYIRLQGYVHYYQHQPGPCRKVEGIKHGSEDFHTLPNGLTFITTGFRTLRMPSKTYDYVRRHNVKGRIYVMDLNNVKAGVKELHISSTSTFNVDTFVPLGISVWEDKKTSRHTVFVVNHALEEEGVDVRMEKFVYDPKKQELVHQTYFSDPTMTMVNNVVATGENSFYFTNSKYFRRSLGVFMEILLELPITNVVYYDGESYSIVDSGLSSPNGIAMSMDSQYVYVSLTDSMEIAVYRRNKNNSLTLVQKYPLHTMPDNIQVDHRSGHLYVGAQPIAHKFFRYANDISSHQAPSQVLNLHVENGVITSAQELFYNHGDLISASSVAIVYDGTLLIGSILDSLVTCQVYVPIG